MLTVGWIMEKFHCNEDIANQALQGFQNFLQWEQSSNLKVVEQETEMVSEKHQFGGCLDLVFEKDGELSIGDIKTSSGIYGEYLCQIAAYRLLYEEVKGITVTGGFHLLRFSKDNADFSHHYWKELKEAEELFLLLRRAYDLDKTLKKRV